MPLIYCKVELKSTRKYCVFPVTGNDNFNDNDIANETTFTIKDTTCMLLL